MSSYIELLKDPRWQKRRLDIMNIDEFTCQICYANWKTLNVHHLIYLPGKMPWEYDDRHLITLCEDCHAAQKTVDLKRAMADLSINASTVLTLLAMLKLIIPEHVTSDRATDQAVFQHCYHTIERFEIPMDKFTEEMRRFKELYG